MRSKKFLASRSILPLLALLVFGLLLATQPAFAQTVGPKAITVPVAPSNLAATAVGTQTVELSWTAPTGGVEVVGYKIERTTSTKTTAALVGADWVVAHANTGNDETNYSDNHSSLAGKSVRYRVAAINSVGVGLPSAAFPATVADAVRLPTSGREPGMPTGFKATLSPTAQTISLAWDAPLQEGESAITTYSVQWSADGKKSWSSTDITLASPTTGTTATHTGTSVADGATLYYRVAATNTQGTGPYSAVMSVTTRPGGVPTVPQTLAATAVGTQTVELTWTAPATPGGTIVGYRIDRNTGAGWVVARADTGNKNLYYSDTHSSLAGKLVRYRVAAINSMGMGVFTAAFPATDADALRLPTSGREPGAPTGLTVTPTDSTNLRLDWTAPSSNGQSPITSYSVQQSPNGNPTWTEITHDDATVTATTTAAQGVTWYYRVAAINTQGTGPYSDIVRLGGSVGEMGTVSLSTQNPVVGTAITATLTDVDTPISAQNWMWQKSMSMDGTFGDIAGATSAMYTPAAGDEGYYLRAKVTYTDKHRSGNNAEATTSNAVTATNESRLLARYDSDIDGRIDDVELGNAIFDHSNDDLSDEDLGDLIFIWSQG